MLGHTATCEWPNEAWKLGPLAFKIPSLLRWHLCLVPQAQGRHQGAVSRPSRDHSSLMACRGHSGLSQAGPNLPSQDPLSPTFSTLQGAWRPPHFPRQLAFPHFQSILTSLFKICIYLLSSFLPKPHYFTVSNVLHSELSFNILKLELP